MSVTVHLSCSWCDATAVGTRPVRGYFESFSGRSHGFGQNHVESVEEVCPDGWVMFDPWTHACYCAACWAWICRENEEDVR